MRKLTEKKNIIAAIVIELVKLAQVFNNHIHIRFRQEKTINLINKTKKQIKLFELV